MTPSIDGRVFDRNQRTGLIQNRVVKSVSHCGEAFTSAVSTRLSMPVNTSVPKTMRRTPNPIFHDLARREDSRAPALHSLARGETDAEQRQRRAQPEHEHAKRDLRQLPALRRQQRGSAERRTDAWAPHGAED